MLAISKSRHTDLSASEENSKLGLQSTPFQKVKQERPFSAVKTLRYLFISYNGALYKSYQVVRPIIPDQILIKSPMYPRPLLCFRVLWHDSNRQLG
jgi:hypothetical protein